jgi:hypothetical protein
MSELSEGPAPETFPEVTVGDNVYLNYLATKVPAPIRSAPVSRLETVAHLKPDFPEWYIKARPINRQYLKELISERWRLQDGLDDALGDLQKDINGFAEPLLVEALKERLHLDLDVHATSVRLYIPALLGFGIDTNASRLRQSTLLEAALHNFEDSETRTGTFRDGSGITRLWNPDLSPYEHKIALTKDSKPNERGLHRHNNQDFLSRDGKYFAVQDDPHTGQPRIEHPDRPTAYQPKLEHNGAGAWHTELDRPVEWNVTELMRRLGTTVDAFDDATLERIRITSGVEEDVLRRLHVENEAPPALLVDTINRFKS